MSCRRRSHRYSSYLDNRLLDDYRYNYRRSRSSRPYTAPSYDPYYNNYPTTTYRSLPPVSPAPYVTPVYETYERRPHTTYVPTAPIAPGPYPTTTYEPSYYRTLESPYRRSVREVYHPRSPSPYPIRKTFSVEPLVEPDMISSNGNTLSYSPHPRPKVDIYHEVPGYNRYAY
uniref:Uncharacterized protein n=1 Tax=Trichobilharzia regenti TaxID=157069 RepID=A0AA85JLD3_TRIRE|nr:unnamed protein product [Trichobilharzia regenti]